MAELRRSAAFRLALGYTALCALAVLVTGLGVYLAAGAMLRHDLDRGVREETAALQREYGEGGLPDLMDALARHRSRGVGFRYALIDRRGRFALREASLTQARLGWSGVRLRENGRPSGNARLLATRLGGGETLVVAADTSDLDRLRAQLLLLLGAGFLLILSLGAGGTIWFGRLLRERLEAISTTADAIVAGDLELRMEVGPSGDEFDRAGASLNLMLDRIAQLVENLRQVSSDVAHDLRTPVQRLRGGVEAALHGPDDIASLRTALERALIHSDTILALFEAILRICEVEAGDIRERFETIDLAKLAEQACEMYAPAVEDGGQTLRFQSDGPIPIAGDHELLMQMFANLLDNAVVHTPVGTTIYVSTRWAPSEAQLIVADDGPGVPERDRERVIQRFVRLDRGRTTSGHGLGLNLVAAIVSAHRGRLIIEDNDPGFRARFHFPASGDQARIRTRS